MMHTRRSFLRCATGATLALPFLESLQAATARPAQRLAVFYVPIGVVRRNFYPGEQALGLVDFNDKEGQKKYREKFAIRPPGFYPHTFTPTLQPLEKMASKISLITGLGRVWQDSSDPHEQCGSCFLSSLAPNEDKTRKMPQGRSLDHVVAEKIGTETPFRTLEFSCNTHHDNKESIHFDNISWYGPDYVAPSMRDPRLAYRRMFGTQGGDPRQITDLVLADARDMKRRLGYSDQEKFGEYVESIRTIERQMDKLSSLKDELDKMKLAEPSAAYIPRGEHIRLMGDLMVAALQSGLTNVATLMIGPERWDTPYLFEEVSKDPLSHHKMSHNPIEYARQLEQVDAFHMRQFAYLVERMDSIREVDGSTLLDNTLFTYGSGLGDGSTHQYDRLPIIIVGSGGGRIKTGRHLQCAEGTPLANLWLTQATALGLSRDRFADSTGVIPEILG
ncbi:uncharacterized protein DUF1552 [Prosthecobacter fusiformis]|uniref:Uncharacterized protein DUF1552 n=1 Tax=Prosthecobacter fusiformis TaxID=48464 RepID=A0A4R7RMI7_9BACT|nr:DUF1552 domain-containing protein [Prosthecobacter fusiformis]TDU66604.1 uncharacterized protein DUF1552 [Prosthecobacter fusiformis]